MSGGQRVRPGCVFRNTGVMGHRWVVLAIAEEGKMLPANWTSLHPQSESDLRTSSRGTSWDHA